MWVWGERGTTVNTETIPSPLEVPFAGVSPRPQHQTTLLCFLSLQIHSVLKFCVSGNILCVLFHLWLPLLITILLRFISVAASQ